MVDFLSPNVSIEEVTPALAPGGISASQMGVVGFTQRGPVNTPTKVRSLEEYGKTFGPNIKSSLVPLTVEQFFTNGGNIAVVNRVVPSGSLKGAVTVDSPAKFTLQASSEGDWSNAFRVEFSGNGNFLDETVGAEQWTKFDVGIQEPDQFGTFLDDEAFNAIQFLDDSQPDFVGRVLNDPDTGSQLVSFIELIAPPGNPSAFAVQTIASEIVGYGDGVTRHFKGVLSGLAATPPTLALGAAGLVTNGLHQYIVTQVDAQGNETQISRPVQITVVDQTIAGHVTITALPPSATGTTRNIYRTPTGSPTFQLLTTIPDNNTTSMYSDNLADSALGVDLPTGAPIDPGRILRNTGGATKVTIVHSAVTITDDGFGNLTAVSGLDPSGRNRIDYETGNYDYTLIAAPSIAANGLAGYKRLPALADYYLFGGSNGVGIITRNEITNPNLQALVEGMYAFEKLQDIVNLVIPDFAGDVTVSRDQIDYAGQRRDRFAIISVPQGQTVPEDQIFVSNSLARSQKRAAVYAPWIKWFNTADNAVDIVPALGAIAGIYANTDATRNVGKAPAGKIDGAITGSSGPEVVFSMSDRDRLYPRKINPIVSSVPTGYAIWGDLTLSDDPDWTFINVVRLFMYLEEFVFQRLHFAIFENNGPALWTRIRMSLEGDFSSFFHQSYFAGQTKADSYAIRCDETNNTQADINAGIVNVDIAVAPNIPAEFIVVRFQQKTATSI